MVMVQFSEAAGSPTERFSVKNGLSADRTLYCVWNDRRALVAELLGSTSEFTTNGLAQYPDMDGCYAMDVEVKPFVDTPEGGMFSDAGSLAAYTGKKAVVNVRYESIVSQTGDTSILPQIQTNTLLTYTAHVAGEFRDMKGSGLEWASSSTIPVPDDIHAQKRIVVIDHQLHWRRLPYVPWVNIRNVGGCVNGYTFLDAPAETILFDGADVTAEYILSVQGTTYSAGWYPGLRYTFKELIGYSGTTRLTWNHTFRSVGTPGWDKLKVRSSGDYMYPGADLTQLFYYAPI
jgi:hypothetical protein